MLRTCFVIMPIQKVGTPDHEYYQALYKDFLKPTLMLRGYEVRRADEVQSAGAITKDIVVWLAEADLVLADLTDLNANVFYELGVRHSLRGRGTIMILDTLRTGYIPFDLGSYRVIQFEGKVQGLGKLRQELEAFIENLESNDIDHRDNPVHDWLPTLPLNALETATGATESRQRARIEELEARLESYRSRYGLQEAYQERAKVSPLDVVKAARMEMSAGNSPLDLIRQAESCVEQQNVVGFLEVLEKLLQLKMVRLSKEQFTSLIVLSGRVGLDEVTTAIFEHALELYPTEPVLRQAQLNHFAHSRLPAYRARARNELLSEIGIKMNDAGECELPPKFDAGAAQLLGVMLDAYHSDGLHEEALRITEALLGKYSDMAVVVRNHGRALKYARRDEEALQWYQRAIWCSDVTDTSMGWLGVDLHNRDRFVDSLEAYLLACLADLNDATYFAHAADELSFCVRESFSLHGSRGRRLPDEIMGNVEDCMRQALLCSLSCPDFSQEDLQVCRRAASRMDNFDFESLLRLRLHGTPPAGELNIRLLSVSERAGVARKMYNLVKSDLTERPKVDVLTP